MVNDFRILLTSHSEKLGIELLGFIPEYYGKITPAGGLVKYIRDVVCDIRDERASVNHTPDAVFALRKENQPALFLLEICSNPIRGACARTSLSILA